MSNLQPPPTYADPVRVDEITGKARFNEIWLNWFLQLEETLNNAGGTVIGSVTSVAANWTGGLVTITGSPITTDGTLAFTIGGTSGGIPYFSSATGWASSAALSSNQIVLGGGVGGAPAVLASLGTTTTLLHGNAAGAPTFGAVVLTTDVSGILQIVNGGTGTNLPAASPSAMTLDGVPGEDGWTIPGPQGVAGATGAPGSAGATGASGPPGSAGEDGLEGEPGMTMLGVPGADGAAGAPGAPGAQGALGYGPPGWDGLDGEDALPIPGVPGAAGNPGATGPQGLPGIPSIDGEDGLDGQPMPGIQGLTGTAGTNGAAGAAGPVGVPGEDGEDGMDGITGSPINYPGTTSVFLRGDGQFAAPVATAGDFSSVLTSTSTIAANTYRVAPQLSINDGGGILVINDTGILAMV